MKLLVLFVVSAIAAASASKMPIPKAPFVTENQELSESEQRTKFIEYLKELNNMPDEEIKKMSTDEILEHIILTLTDRKEQQYLRASAIRKHLKYFVAHRGDHVPKLPFMRLADDEEKPTRAPRPSRPTRPVKPSNLSTESNVPTETKSASNPTTESKSADPSSPDFKHYLVQYVHSLDGTVEEALSFKSIPELTDIALSGLNKRLNEEKDPAQADLIEKHIGYFRNSKTRQ